MDIVFSRVKFVGYTHRLLIHFKTAEPDLLPLHLYTNSDNLQGLKDFIEEKKSDKVLSYEIIHQSSKEQDEKTGAFLDKVLKELEDSK